MSTNGDSPSNDIFDGIDLGDMNLDEVLNTTSEKLTESIPDEGENITDSKPKSGGDTPPIGKSDENTESNPKQQHKGKGEVSTPLGNFSREVIILWVVVIVMGVFGFQYFSSRTKVTDPVKDLKQLEQQVEDATSIGKMKSYVENYQTIVKHSNMNSDYKALIEMIQVPFGENVSFAESQRITLSKIQQARLQIYNYEVDQKQEKSKDGFSIKF